MSDEESQRVAGHLPAVKAGGMRIVQHKTPNSERAPKDNIDCTGLTNPPNITPSALSVSGASAKGNADFSTEAAQVAHQLKATNTSHANFHKQAHNINQPRK